MQRNLVIAATRRGVSIPALAALLAASPAGAQTIGVTLTGIASGAGVAASGTVAQTQAVATGSVTTDPASAPATGSLVTGIATGAGNATSGTVVQAQAAGNGSGIGTPTLGVDPGVLTAGAGVGQTAGATATIGGTNATVTTGGAATTTGTVAVPAAGSIVAGATGAAGGILTATGGDANVASAVPALVSAANSVALGSGSVAARGAQAAYAAARLATPQVSVGEVSVGAAGLARQITNVAAGLAATDAVNVAQLASLGYDLDNLAAVAVRYDDAGHGHVTLGDAARAVGVSGLAAGNVALGSTDAVTGGQLFAVDAQVTVNASDIANLRTQLATLNVTVGAAGAGGTVTLAAGPAQYSNAASPTTPNGGAVSNDVTMVGANGGAVAVHNVAAGQVAVGSTDAVNGGQLYATNQAVAAVGRNAVQYDDAAHTSVTLGDGQTPVALHNIGPGTSPTDAVNVAQLDAAGAATLSSAKSYTDGKIAALGYSLDKVRRDANGGTSMALAAAALPQPYEAGRGMLAMAGGTYRGEAAFAVGASKAFVDGHTVLKMGATYGTHASVGASAGLGYQF